MSKLLGNGECPSGALGGGDGAQMANGEPVTRLRDRGEYLEDGRRVRVWKGSQCWMITALDDPDDIRELSASRRAALREVPQKSRSAGREGQAK